MKKKMLSIFVSVCLLLAIIQPILSVIASDSVWSGGTSVPALSGGYYQISSGEELAWFAQQVNSGSNSIKGRMTDNIILNEQYSTANNFTPIGTPDFPFTGQFDGGGFTITNLYINTDSDYVGLFGYVKGDKPEVNDEDDSSQDIFTADPPVMISNIKLSGADITGNQNVGGICGFISYGIISDCTFSGTINAKANSAGGIAGYIFDYSVVRRSYSEGSVSGVIRTGGIAGYVNSNSTVLKCYSTVTVFSNAGVNGCAGGIVGTLSASTINGCYFLGRVSGPKNVGGIVGYNSYSTLLGCYTLGDVYTTIVGNTEYMAAVAGYSLGGTYYNCYYNEPSCRWEDENATARTLDQMKKFSFARELNENGNAFTFDYMVLNNGYPVLAWTLETAVWAGGKEEPAKDSAGYYLITTADELAWFAALVNGSLPGGEQNTSANARVTENLLLNIFINEGQDDTNVWTPIGTGDSPFNGTFIGNYFNIAGIYTAGTTYQGLFGNVGADATISQVVLLDCLITGTENVGGIAGYNKGTISNSCNDSTVRGGKAVGGIAGYNTGTVTASYNVGTIEGNSASGGQVGGITGNNQRGKIRQCFNNGAVQGNVGNYYGGIAGNSTGDGIHNCYNSGDINGAYYVGGIAGYVTAATITNCYNRGKVNSQNSVGTNVGNFIGKTNNTCTLTNCYYDTTILDSVMTNLTSAIGKTTAELTGASIANILGFTSGIWSSKASNSYFDYYPQITEIATVNCAKMKEDSLESAKIVQKQYILQVKVDGREDVYSENFQDAFTSIGKKKGTLIPVKDLVLGETIEITQNITMHGLGFARKITRDSSFTGTLFDVTGTLTLGDIKNGSDENTLLTFDGNKDYITATSPMFNISTSSGTLNTYPGFEIKNAKSSIKGSAIVVDSATANINGGIISSNEATGDAGALYNNAGTVNITGGTFTSNQSITKGGALYNNLGTVNISGGTFSDNYAKTIGGAIYMIGGNSIVTISEEATFSTNSAKAGGAIYINSGSVIMTGGTMSQNFAYNTRSSNPTAGGGGAITIAATGTFAMSGGVIDSNYIYTQTGSSYGINVYGNMQMSGSAAITNNDIYLYSNKTVELTGALTAGAAATITPSSYTSGSYVLSGSAIGLGYSKIQITPNGNEAWNVTSSGYIMNTEIINVVSLSKFGSFSVDYRSLAEAVANVGPDEEGIITVIGNNTISETLKIYGDVTILSETDQTYTSTRSGSFTGDLFEVQDGGTLRLGYSEMEAEGGGEIVTEEESDFETDSVGGQYYLDGGSSRFGAIGTSSIKVLSGGRLFIYDGFNLENGYSTVGTIDLYGKMYMYGGVIRNNFAANGGAVNIAPTGSLYLYSGLITNNFLSGKGYGKAIYCQGNIIRANHNFVYYQNGVEVARQNSFTTVSSDNDIYLADGKMITLENAESKILLSETSDVPVTSTVSASPMLLTLESYYIGKQVLTGSDINIHNDFFNLSLSGYSIDNEGKLYATLLVPDKDSSCVVTRGTLNYVSGIDMSRNTAGVLLGEFANDEKIEITSPDGTILSSGDMLTTGCIVNLYNSDSTEIVDTIYVVIYGDVDCDGYINGMDSMLISCYVQKMLTASELSAVQIEAADVDNSSSVNNTDAQYIQKCGAYLQKVQQY